MPVDQKGPIKPEINGHKGLHYNCPSETYPNIFDELVKSRKGLMIVIPAKAGIQ